MWLHLYRVFVVLCFFVDIKCEGTNTNFNNQIREYITTDDGVNLTHGQIKTLQKQSIGLGRYASLAPIQNPIKFKEVPDSALSGSSHSRGLLHHGHSAGYGYTDYDEPHYGHGFEYSVPDHHHYDFHDIGHHHIGHGYGHSHHKFYDHALATKSLLWPIAGIALLGAAAALVTNPVLLQLGVVSGRRRRRHTDAANFLYDSLKNQTETEQFMKNSLLKKWSQKTTDDEHDKTNTMTHKIIKKRVLQKPNLKTINLEKPKSMQIIRNPKYVQSIHLEDYNDDDDRRRFIPIPLKYKNV